MAVKERLLKEIKSLDEQQLYELEQYVAFLKFRSRFMLSLLSDENQIAELYNKFAKEDSNFAEEGINDYVDGLIKEDKQ
ncbi:MAG: hypothetical protein R6U52_09235 [Kosmotogaceae bacterium]